MGDIVLAKPSLSERIQSLLDRTEYRLVETEEEREAIYRLRYEAYRREEFIPQNALRQSWDAADDLPNQQTFAIYIDGKLASSVRLNVLSSVCTESPSMEIFSDALVNDLAAGKSFIDPSRFVADKEAARKYPELPYLTLRIAAMACIHYGADSCLSLVRPEHGAFYRRVFRSTRIAGVRRCSYLDMDVQLMSTDVDVIRDDVYRRYPFFQSDILERQELFGSVGAMIGSVQDVHIAA